MELNEILSEDWNRVYSSCDLSELKDSVFLITGATGLLGKNLIHFIDYLNGTHSYRIKILALTRDKKTAARTFKKLNSTKIKFIRHDLSCGKKINARFDFFIHGAAVTDSREITRKPVETTAAAVNGTLSVLDAAKKARAKSGVFLSSMEVYGTSENRSLPLKEEELGLLDLTRARTSYAESKRLCENLCASYFLEYGLNVKTVRLCQTCGPLASSSDRRITSEITRCAAEGRCITLNTPALSKRPLLYTSDAVAAILTVLLKGKEGETYNAANPETFSSVRENAELAAEKFSCGKTKVVFDFKDDSIFPPPSELDMDIQKILLLGWKPYVQLEEIFLRTVSSIKNRK